MFVTVHTAKAYSEKYTRDYNDETKNKINKEFFMKNLSFLDMVLLQNCNILSIYQVNY